MKPISNTAFYCCGIRMADATQKNSICRDRYAKLFMNEYGRSIYDKFKGETLSNASIIVRHRVIDDVLRQLLLSTPDLGIINIGAGFDSRPYRLIGGTWFELDDPELMAYKNNQLPILECRNPLHRISIDFCADSLEEKLSSISHSGPIIFVLEGIAIYLTSKEIATLLDVLRKIFPKHQLICDLVNYKMVQIYGQKLLEIIEEIGTSFKAVDTPESIFLISGYQIKSIISVAEMSVDLGINMISKFILRYFFSAEVEGNSVYLLERNGLNKPVIKS